MRASDVHENLAHLSRELVELLAEYKALQQASVRHEAAYRRALATKLGIPGLMILHSNGAIVYAQVVGESRKLTRDQLEAGINRLRENHYATCQRRRA